MIGLKEQVMERTRVYERIYKLREAREERKQKLIAKNHFIGNNNETYVDKNSNIKLKRKS